MRGGGAIGGGGVVSVGGIDISRVASSSRYYYCLGLMPPIVYSY